MAVLFSSAQVNQYLKYSGQKIPKPIFTPFGKGKIKEPALLKPFAVIPQNYYTQCFGIICKKELALEKATKIPFRFRLGSLQQCNYLEGKR